MLWKITADELMSWANSRVSQGDLPELIRRLIHSTIPSSKILRIVFPAGNSIGLPGWDGVLETSVGNAWVPKGESRWELSCQKNSAMKIVADYQKRTGETSADQQQKLTFVFATPRRVRGKPKWMKEHPDEWRKIRILDAVNLEEWLEIAPSVSLWLAEKMGKNIDGFRSLDSEWDRWAGATDPKISAGLVLADRENASKSLRKFLDSDEPKETFTVVADSKDEAAAFVCAEIEKSPELRGRLIVVRKRVDNLSQFTIGDSPAPIFLFVDKNDAKDIGGMVSQSHVIIADSQGGNADESACRLNRIWREKFIAQLKEMGLSWEVANRRERESGRSLTVLRRRLAKNSALKTPEWAQSANSRAMIVAALVGEWLAGNGANTRQIADQKIVADMRGSQYKDFEREVVRFMGMDDAPIERIDDSIERIGGFWQVKSRLDALLAVAKDITPSDLDDFFRAAKNVLLAEYEVSARFPRPAHSDCLRRGLAESLILLSVYAESFHAIGNVGGQVDDFIRYILADKKNWISIAGFMPQFAEASPKVFLDAVESDLEQDDPIIQTMFDHGIYTHLLWAFEKLAWEKNGVFERIVFALARMSSFRTNGSSSSSPQDTLSAFFRPWLPQCAASLDERDRVLRQLTAKCPSCAKKLTDSMLRLRDITAIHTLRPQWKHSPSDFEIKLTAGDVHSARRSAIDIARSPAQYKIGAIVSLIGHIDAAPSQSDAEKICARVKSWATKGQTDNDLSVAQNAARLPLWRAKKNRAKNEVLSIYEGLLHALMPRDSVFRHKWLFDHNPYDPEEAEFDDNEFDKKQARFKTKREDALVEIRHQHGDDGIVRLVSLCDVRDDLDSALNLYAEKFLDNDEKRLDFVGKLLHADMENRRIRAASLVVVWAIPADSSRAFAEKGLDRAASEKWTSEMILNFALSLRPCDDVWSALEDRASQIIDAYWKEVDYHPIFSKSPEINRRFADEKIARGRSQDVFVGPISSQDFSAYGADRTLRLLDAVSLHIGRNTFTTYSIEQAFSYLVKEIGADNSELFRLETRLFRLLGCYDSEYRFPAIYRRLATDPQLFVDLISRLYGRDDGSETPKIQSKLVCRILNLLGKSWAFAVDLVSRYKRDNSSEAPKIQPGLAHRILNPSPGRSWTFAPGLGENGAVSEQEFLSWFEAAHRLSEERGRRAIAESYIGKMLFGYPVDKEGVPPDAIGKFFEKRGNKTMASGYYCAVCNSRGVYWTDGGKPEKELAEKYAAIAGKLRERNFSRLARVYDDVATGYDKQAEQEKTRSDLRDRGHY